MAGQGSFFCMSRGKLCTSDLNVHVLGGSFHEKMCPSFTLDFSGGPSDFIKQMS
jgi:hypothetical protein